MSKQFTNNKNVQTIKKTYPTNDKHIKTCKKQYVVITHAKSIQTMLKQLQTIITHNKNETNIPNK